MATRKKAKGKANAKRKKPLVQLSENKGLILP
jgi:hypothetical protein